MPLEEPLDELLLDEEELLELDEEELEDDGLLELDDEELLLEELDELEAGLLELDELDEEGLLELAEEELLPEELDELDAGLLVLEEELLLEDEEEGLPELAEEELLPELEEELPLEDEEDGLLELEEGLLELAAEPPLDELLDTLEEAGLLVLEEELEEAGLLEPDEEPEEELPLDEDEDVGLLEVVLVLEVMLVLTLLDGTAGTDEVDGVEVPPQDVRIMTDITADRAAQDAARKRFGFLLTQITLLILLRIPLDKAQPFCAYFNKLRIPLLLPFCQIFFSMFSLRCAQNFLFSLPVSPGIVPLRAVRGERRILTNAGGIEAGGKESVFSFQKVGVQSGFAPSQIPWNGDFCNFPTNLRQNFSKSPLQMARKKLLYK